ncbi:CLUMA_CG015193, isoform A [Clunio marinus]|uniref:Syntaxin-18 n=1 Tax=Clunio marinus TaxID=568069 RepID=A0A1J1IQP7_9DIPT|nr:CLUMA_CG015193, isoform A [Clunio marinus]
MDITPLFKACVKTIKLHNKSVVSPDKNRILKKSPKDEFSKKTKDIKYQISQLRNFLIENRTAYIQYASHLKRSAQMTNEERDVIDRESEKIINICTQFICELKAEYNNKHLTKQHRTHCDAVFELLANYLKGVYNIFNDQKNYRIQRDLETYKFLKLDSEKRHDKFEVDRIEYKEDMDLGENSDEKNDELPDRSQNDIERDKLITKPDTTRKSADTDTSANTMFIEDDANTSRHQQNFEHNLTAEELQMLEIENKQMISEFKGLNAEVEQIEKHVYDIAKLQDLFTEKVALQKGDIERISNTVVSATENVREANEQIKEAIQRNAGLRVYVLFFLLVMSFSLLFLDWYNE